VGIQGSFCSEPPHGFIYNPCELGKRLAVCLFYFILSRLLVCIGMCACVLRNNFADRFLLLLGCRAGPGPSATTGSNRPLSLFHITARFPGQVLLGREKSAGHCRSCSTISCHAKVSTLRMEKILEDHQHPHPHHETSFSLGLQGCPCSLTAHG